MKIKYLIIVFISLIIVNVKASGDISISKNDISLVEGGTATFTINATNAAGKVDIVSTDSSVATVDVSEYFFDTSLNNSSVTITVRAVKQGEANIEVRLTDVATFDYEELTGKKICKVNVTKSEVSPTSLTITGTNRVKVGEEVTLTSTVSPSGASQEVTWSSSNSNVATISSSGVVRGINKGSVVITATSSKKNSVSNVFEIEVYDDYVEPVQGAITIRGTSSVYENKDILLSVDGVLSNQTVVWTSSNTSIATVSNNGTVHGVKSGNVVITASILGNESIKDTFNVSVIREELVEVPKTASNVSIIVYISVIVMIGAAAGIIYYVNKNKKNEM